MASGVYNRFKANLFSGLVDLAGSGSHTINCALLNSNHTFVAANNTWTAISANEISGTGYTANGQALANKSVTQDDNNSLGVFDADDVTWAAATITARYAVLYDNTINNKPLICCFDFGSNQSSSGSTFTLQFNASGIISIA